MSTNISGLASGGSSNWELIDGNWTGSKSARSVYNIDGTSPSAFTNTLIDLYVADCRNWLNDRLSYDDYNEWMYTCVSSDTHAQRPGTSVVLRKIEIENLFELLQAHKINIVALTGSNWWLLTTGSQSPSNTYSVTGFQIAFTSQNGTECSTELFRYSSNANIWGKIYGRK